MRHRGRHPVHALLAHHAGFGTLPSAKELDELGLAPEHRAAVRRAASEAKALRDEGSWSSRNDANQHALEAAHDIIAALPRAQQDPSYNHADPLEDVSDPDALAAAIPRATALAPPRRRGGKELPDA